MPGTSLSAVRPALQTPAELLAAGRPADAAEALAAVVAETPTYAAAYVLLGVALDAAGRPDEALTAWHRAAFLVPRSPLVLRERQRLIDTTRADDAPPRHNDLLAQGDERLDPPAEPLAQHTEPTDQSAEPLAQGADPLDPSEDPVPLAEELPTIQTAPLDDFIFADSLPGPDDGDDDFDPDSFDFSAFDIEGDGESWLDTGVADAPADSAADAFASAGEAAVDGAAPDPLIDWGDDTESDAEPDAVRILLPDEPAPEAPLPPAVDEAWAVFEDLPVAPPAAPGPSVADMLTPEAAGAESEGADDWFADASFAAATPIFHEPIADDSAEDDAFAADDIETDAVETDTPAAAAPSPGAAEPETTGLLADESPAEALSAPSASVFAEPAAGTVADELDFLIASLETAPRIRPDPAFDGPAVRVPTADTGEMASETLARIYAAQHQYVQAALVYETLAAREPERAAALLEQAAAMRARRP